MLITGNSKHLLHRLKDHLAKWFHMKDLGDLRHVLGIGVARSNAGIFLTQRKYVLDLLKEIAMTTAKPVYLPMDPNVHITQEGSLLPEPDKYKRLIGKLIYLTITRPVSTILFKYSVNLCKHLHRLIFMLLSKCLGFSIESWSWCVIILHLSISINCIL